MKKNVDEGSFKTIRYVQPEKDETTDTANCFCQYEHSATTPCAKAWEIHVRHLGSDRLLSLDRFQSAVKELLSVHRISDSDTYSELMGEGGIEKWFSKEPSKFGDRLFHLTTVDSLEKLGEALQVGLDKGWLKFNPLSLEYQMITDNSSTDLAGLMWQIALTNWETTKADLSTPQVAMMARLSLQTLGSAVFPPSSREYRPEEVDKALEKTRVVVAELNERMRAEKRDSLPPPQVDRVRE